MNNKLNEKLDFTFSYKDFNLITELLNQYMDDRVYVFNSIVSMNDGFTDDLKKEYIHYFIAPFMENKPYHKYLSKINHFICREYEIYNYPEISEIVANLKSIFNTDYNTLEIIEDFEMYEMENINLIYALWEQFTSLVANYPILNLDTYNYEKIGSLPIYYNNPPKELLNEINEFILRMENEFPTSIRRLDSIILCSKDYIEFVAGKGTMAYFVSDTVFIPDDIKEDDYLFFITTLYHEFGHFIFSLLPEECYIIWYDYFDEWKQNKLKLTRDKEQDVDAEELFADVFSLIFNPNIPDYLHEPSQIIMNTFIDILNRGFTINE